MNPPVATTPKSNYVTYKWLLAASVTIIGVSLTAFSIVLSMHAQSPHSDAVNRNELKIRDKLQDERQTEIIRRLERIEAKLEKR